MAVYGLGCHPQNIIWTEAKLRSIYYYVGDRPVYKLPFGPKCHELFVILHELFDKYSMNWINNEGLVMVFNTTINNISVISWLSVLLVEETAVPGEKTGCANQDK
jgi:hypothetical protein